MTGLQIAKAYAHYASRFVGYRLSPNSVGMAAEIARVERDYGIPRHERVPADVAKTVLRHLMYSFWQCRNANRQVMANNLAALSHDEPK